MAEKDTIFASKIKQAGIFNFNDFYKFCYDWLLDETDMDFVLEKKYSEKIESVGKKVEIEWEAHKKVTDYFKFIIKVKIRILKLEKIEINQGGTKIKTNKGTVELDVKGVLVRDYQGKFEKNAFQIFLRNAYEKWIIPSRIDQFEGKLFSACDEFLAQAKSYLALEGKR